MEKNTKKKNGKKKKRTRSFDPSCFVSHATRLATASRLACVFRHNADTNAYTTLASSSSSAAAAALAAPASGPLDADDAAVDPPLDVAPSLLTAALSTDAASACTCLRRHPMADCSMMRSARSAVLTGVDRKSCGGSDHDTKWHTDTHKRDIHSRMSRVLWRQRVPDQCTLRTIHHGTSMKGDQVHARVRVYVRGRVRGQCYTVSQWYTHTHLVQQRLNTMEIVRMCRDGIKLSVDKLHRLIVLVTVVVTVVVLLTVARSPTIIV